MSGIVRQLRAMFYVLARNLWVWGALALVVLDKLWCVYLVGQGMSYGLQDSLFRDKLLLLAVLLAAAGIVAGDQRDDALRSACATERGRAGYVVARLAAVAAVTLGLLAVAAVLDLAFAALPGCSVIMASPEMHAPARVAAGVLSVLVLAEGVAVAGMLLRGTSALATLGVLGLAAFVGLLVLRVLPTAMGDAVAAFLDSVLPLEGLTASVIFTTARGQLLPLDAVHAYVVPVLWLAALFGLARLVMARRAV